MERLRVKGRFVRDGDEGVGREAPVRAQQARSCRVVARARVAAALPEIVDRFIQEAIKGSIAHANAVMVLGGLGKGEIAPRKKRPGKTLAALLLEELRTPVAKPAVGSPEAEGEVEEAAGE